MHLDPVEIGLRKEMIRMIYEKSKEHLASVAEGNENPVIKFDTSSIRRDVMASPEFRGRDSAFSKVLEDLVHGGIVEHADEGLYRTTPKFYGECEKVAGEELNI